MKYVLQWWNNKRMYVLQRKCSGVKSDVIVEVTGEDCSSRNYNDSGMSRLSPSTSHDSHRNNNAGYPIEVRIHKNIKHPANQMMSGRDSTNQKLKQENIRYGKTVHSTSQSDSEDFIGQTTSCDSQSTLQVSSSEGYQASYESSSSERRSKYKGVKVNCHQPSLLTKKYRI
jgi:hypothetical protein